MTRLLCMLVILTSVLCLVVESATDRSQWVEPNELRTTKKNRSTGKKKNAADKVRAELMELEEGGDEWAEYTTDANVLELLEQQRDVLTSQFTSKLTPVQRMVSTLVGGFNRAGSTFGKKSKADESHVEHFQATIKLDHDDYRVLKRFSDNSDPTTGQVQDAMQLINEMIVNLEISDSDEAQDWMGELIAQIMNPQYLLLGNVALLMVLFAIIMYHTMQLDKWQFFWRLLLVVFMASCVWTWLHMYKEKQAEMQARWAKRHIPTACQQQVELSAPLALIKYLKSTVQLPEPDECTEYHKDLLIDPIYEVPPTMAFSRTCTSFLLEPLQHIAHHISLFIQHLFKDLPFQYYPIALLLTVLLVLIPLFCWAGYCLRLPLGIYLGPSAAPQPLPLPVHPIAPLQPYQPASLPANTSQNQTQPQAIVQRSPSNKTNAHQRKSRSAAPIKLYMNDGINNKGVAGKRAYIRLQQVVSSDNGSDGGSDCGSRSRSLSLSRADGPR